MVDVLFDPATQRIILEIVGFQLKKEIQPIVTNLHSHNFWVAVDRVVYVFGKGSILVILQNQETCIMQLFVVVLNIVLLSKLTRPMITFVDIVISY